VAGFPSASAKEGWFGLYHSTRIAYQAKKSETRFPAFPFAPVLMSICPLRMQNFSESLMNAILFTYILKTAKREDFSVYSGRKNLDSGCQRVYCSLIPTTVRGCLAVSNNFPGSHLD
jgi:hypothetical protein